MIECVYCGKIAINEPMYVVKKAIKVKGRRKCYEKIGYCCEQCETKDKPIMLEKGE